MGESDSKKRALEKLARVKRAALFGCGASAEAAARLLKYFGAQTDFYQQSGTNHAVDSVDSFSEFTESIAKGYDLVVYSPAFRPDHKWIETAKKSGVKTVCEPDLGAAAFGGKIFAVTGTDGKTTVTRFITEALAKRGEDAFAAGNIGEPLSNFTAKFLEEDADDFQKTAVCELSSFQTFRLENLKPDALVWTNFAEDHLDWHRDMREYFFAKFNLVNALEKNPDTCEKIFVCGDDVARAAETFGVVLPRFARVLNFAEMKRKGLMDLVAPFDTFVQAQNFAVVKTLWQKLGFDECELFECAKTFSLPMFRFGQKTEVGGVEFYNDSKATNTHAAMAAINELSAAENLIWIGGGKDKFCPLDELCNALLKSAKGAVLIGQTSQKLAEKLAKLPLGAKVCSNLEDAVEIAFEMCRGRHGAKVLFSPAFSSFGMFSGYAERGKVFEKAVLCLKNSK